MSRKMSAYEGNSLGVGAICGLGGFTILSLLPCFAVPAYGLIAIGGACVAEYIEHWSVFNQIFKSKVSTPKNITNSIMYPSFLLLSFNIGYAYSVPSFGLLNVKISKNRGAEINPLPCF